MGVELARKIKALRVLRGMTQLELAKAASLARSTLSAFEAGIARPSPAALRMIKDALEWPEDADQAFAILEPRERQSA